MKKLFILLAAAMLAAGVPATAERIDLSSVITSSATVTYSAENDATYPWSVTDGELRVSHTKTDYTSWCTLQFTSPGDCSITVTFNNNTNGNDYFYIETEDETKSYNSTRSGSPIFFLPAGTHTVRFGYKPYSSIDRGYYAAVTKINIVDMPNEAIEINLSEAGTLGVEALSRVSSLPDMKYMKLTGPMNSADWTTISNMTGLRYCDMAGTSVTDIPASAFVKCALKFCKFPTNLKTIGEKAFCERYMVGPLTFPRTLESIGSQAFAYNYFTSLEIPAGVTFVDEYAFYNNPRLATVNFGGTMTSIPRYCFKYCSKLVSVTGLDNVATVGHCAFEECSKLETLGQFTPLTIGTNGFFNCNELRAIDLSLTTTIESDGFYSCYKITDVDLTNLTSLSSEAFKRCNSLTTVRFNDKITSIPGSAFNNCENLEEVYLGASVRSVGSYAFRNDYATDDKVTKVYVKSPTPPAVNGTPFANPTTTVLYVPEYAMVSYKLHDYWSKFTNVDVNTEEPTELRLYGALELTSNARIPGTPDVHMGWASSDAKGASFIINGDNPQPFGNFLQVITNYRYSSSYDPCTTTLISRCANMSSRSSTVRYYCNSSNTYWYYITMPFDVRRSEITTQNGADIAVRYYDGQARANYGGTTGSSWKDVPADGILRAGQGYIFCLSKADYINFPATDETRNMLFTSGAVSTELNEYISNTSADSGWNLVGNPYSCFYDIYQMDYTAPITVWSTTDKTFRAYSVADDELALYPLQAFFVQKPAGVDAITFQPRGRQITLNIEHAANAPARAAAASDRKVINLVLTDGNTEDMTRIVVNPNESDDFDAATDASKMMSYEGTAQLYSWNADGIFAINEGSHASGTVALGLWAPQNGTYTIDATRADAQVVLFDRGGQVSMPYTFEAEAGTDNNRFTIAIVAAPAGIGAVDADSTHAATYDLLGRPADPNAKGLKISKGKKSLNK